MAAANPSPDEVPVITRSEESDAEVGRAIVWAVERRRVFVAVLALAVAGAGAGWTGWQQLEGYAEERVLRRQAAEAQVRAVASNGTAVAELGRRVAQLEAATVGNGESIRTAVELLMVHAEVREAVAGDRRLSERAAKVVANPGL